VVGAKVFGAKVLGAIDGAGEGEAVGSTVEGPAVGAVVDGTGAAVGLSVTQSTYPLRQVRADGSV
jgi:hypothetical protein